MKVLSYVVLNVTQENLCTKNLEEPTDVLYLSLVFLALIAGVLLSGLFVDWFNSSTL
jgi:uncharacterized membrane protein YwzB